MPKTNPQETADILPRMQGRPFGVDEAGRRIDQINGKVIRGSIEHMWEVVGQQAEQKTPAGASAEEREARVAQAKAAALDRLVEMLNQAIEDERYHVSREYLLNEGNNYSREFDLFVNEYGRIISNDPNFYFNRGTKTIPKSMVHLGRPFSLRQIYNLLPRFTAKFVDTDIRVVHATPTSAVIQWYAASQLEQVPLPHHLPYVRMSCQAYQGAYASIPALLYPALPPARVHETRCQVEGAECCEWEFTWQNPKPRRSLRLWGGTIASLLSLTYVLLRLPSFEWVALLALLPLAGGWYAWRVKNLAYERERQERILLEQREKAEEQYDRIQEAYAELQIANVDLKRKISELTAMHELGLALSATLDLHDLLDASLRAVTAHLNFDRAMVMLLDEERRVLSGGRLSGGTPEMAAVIEGLEVSLEDERAILTQVLHARRPTLVKDVERVGGETTQSVMRTLGTRAFLGVPLMSKGRAVGILVVDNALTGRGISQQDQDLLSTVANQIAVAAENARLYQQIEAHSRTLEKRVQERTSALQAANEELAAEKSKLDAVLRNIADALLVTDPADHILLVNPAFEELLGKKSAALSGRPLQEEIPVPELHQLVSQARDGQTTAFSIDISLPTGVVLKAVAAAIQEEAHLRATPGQGEERIIGVVTVLRDITHEAEVDRMKTDFISMVSHELRTPLTSVLGFARLIHKSFTRNVAPLLPHDHPRGQRAVERITGNLNVIINEGERLTRLINDVLDIAKMEAGKVEWHMTDVAFKDVIENAVASTSALAQEKGLPVRVQVPPALPLVTADQDRLTQVVTNLLSNAIKFTDSGEIRVTAERIHSPASEIGARLSPGDWLLVRVADTGIGITPQNLPEVFEKFKQVGDTLTDRPKGTGLGLPICKEIVEHHEGHIWAESKMGVGSRFSFALPLSPAAPPATYAPRTPMVQEIKRRLSQRVPAANERPPLILVVDDDANIRELLRQELDAEGYRVIEAADGTSALRAARAERPDLIILDLMMPGLDGFDVTRLIRADEITADIPILILSVLDDRERGLYVGADGYLTKPVEMVVLQEQIAELLAQRESRRVLVAVEDETALDAIAQALQEQGYEIVATANGDATLRQALETELDVAILDAALWRRNHQEMLKVLKHPTDKEASVIVLIEEH